MSEKVNFDGGCAYPVKLDFQGPCTNPLTGKSVQVNQTDSHIDLGLTKRDYFAGLAMQSLYSRDEAYESFDALAEDAYCMADAMIRTRKS